MTKTAILAQRKVAGEDLVVKLLDEGLRVSYMVSLVGTGELDQLFFGSRQFYLTTLTGLAMVKFLKEGPCHTMIGELGIFLHLSHLAIVDVMTK